MDQHQSSDEFYQSLVNKIQCADRTDDYKNLLCRMDNIEKELMARISEIEKRLDNCCKYIGSITGEFIANRKRKLQPSNENGSGEQHQTNEEQQGQVSNLMSDDLMLFNMMNTADPSYYRQSKN